MKIVSKKEFSVYPEGTVFAEYKPHKIGSIEIKLDTEFGAVSLVPDLDDGSYFSWDWSIGDYTVKDRFMIFEESDIKQMMGLLEMALKHKINF